MALFQIIDKLNRDKFLSADEWVELFDNYTEEDYEYSSQLAREITVKKYGKKIFIRGIVEFSNICKNDCFYCGIRKSNTNAQRYRLEKEEILDCCHEGYQYGFRTFVLQSGEDGFYTTEKMADIVRAIKSSHPDCAVTLSLGEKSREEFQALFDAGGDRYLLRHETANLEHYNKLHPSQMSFEHRMNCLKDLKEIGFQTGAGMMIGSPFQTSKCLAEDMVFLGEFKPHMVGIGPFLPHKDTPFRDYPKGGYELTLFCLSLVRIMLPNVLLPATTALGTIRQNGREQGVLSGANVIMPNLSPASVRKKYMLYDNKICTGNEAAQSIANLRERMKAIGYEIEISRGDYVD